MTTLLVVSGLAFEAKIARGVGNETVYGLDRAQLVRDLEAAIAHGAKAIISFGTAGGLALHVKPGDVVVPKSVVAANGRWPTDVRWSKALTNSLPGAYAADLYGADRPIASANEKAEIARETGAIAVDMESHVAAEIAARHGLPFAVLRVVLDPADRTLPEAALGATRPDGTSDIFAVLRSLAKKPGQLPALVKLAGDASRAKASLLRCRQTLGPLFGFGIGVADAGHLTLDVK